MQHWQPLRQLRLVVILCAGICSLVLPFAQILPVAAAASAARATTAASAAGIGSVRQTSALTSARAAATATPHGHTTPTPSTIPTTKPHSQQHVAHLPTRQQAKQRRTSTPQRQAQPQIGASSVVGAGDLTWNSGLVHENPVSYAIFWGPSWNDGAGTLTTDGQIPRNLLTDAGGTAFASILTQYYDAATHLASSHTLAGVYLDFSTPPSTDSCSGVTIEDFAIQSEISRAITAQNWPSDRDNATYFVFTPNSFFTDDGNGFCSEQAYCAYHSWSPVANVAYAVLPYPTDLTSCGVPSSPNGNAAGDALANATSYELFGSATDPQVGTGWLDSLSYEIGEKCSYDFSAGTTTLAGGHTYELQTEYSNATSACVNAAQPHLQLTPSAISLAVTPGTTPAVKTVSLTNTGIAALSWSQTTTLPGWLTLTPSASTLAPGATQTLTLTFAATSTTPQTYAATLLFADPAADNSPLSLSITVSTTAHIQVQPSSVSLTTLPGASPAAQTLTLTNSGQATMNWSQTATLPNWLSLTPTSGSVAPGANQTLTLTFSTPSTTPQAYTTTLTFTDPAADNAPLTMPITVTAGYPHIQAAPGSIALKVGVEETPAPQILTLSNTGVGPLTWTQTATLPPWLTLSASSGSLPMGAAQDLTLTFAPTGSSPQTYSTTLTFAGPNADNTPVSVPVSVQALPSKLPAPWLDQDIGSVGIAGSARYAKGTFTVKGAGADIWGGADAFHYVYRPWSGNGAIIARVASLTNTNDNAKAGIMIRESLAANATNVFLDVAPTWPNGATALQWRSMNGGSTTNWSISGTAPRWVKLIRHDTNFLAYVSSDGVTWSLFATANVSMATAVYVGLAVTSHNTSALNTAQFDNFSVVQTGTFKANPAAVYATTTPTGTPPAQTLTLNNSGVATLNWHLTSTLPSWVTISATSGTLSAGKSQALTLTFAPTGGTEQTYTSALTFADPTADNSPFSVPVTVVASYSAIPAPPWAELDIGGPSQAGSATYSGGTFTVSGSGGELPWNSGEQFHFVYQPLTGDGQIVARVASIGNTDGSAKAGVMIRESLDVNAANAFAFLTPSNSTQFSVRTASGATTAGIGSSSGAAPYWVKLTRSGNTFSGMVSADGVTWQSLGTTTVAMVNTVYVGLAVTSHNNGNLNTSTFDNVTVATAPYGHLQSTPAAVSVTTAPGASPAAQTLTLSNTGQGALDWSLVSTLPSWLAVTPTTGSLAAGASQTLTLNFTTPSTTPQQYITTLTLRAPSADNTAIAIPVTVNSAPAVLNPSFETPNLGNGYQYNPSGASWTFSGAPPSGSGLTGNGNGFTGGNPNAPSGTQVAFLQAQGTITQAITNFQDGSYQVTFAAARRGNGGGNEDFQILLDTTLIGTFTPASTLYADLTTATFSTTAGTHTLKFVGLNTAGGDNTAFIDNVRIHLPYSHFQASPSSVYATVAPGATPAPQTLTLTNSGQSTLNWSQIATLPSWLSVTPTSGALDAGASQVLTLTFGPTGTTPQSYNAALTFIDSNSIPNTDNSPFAVAVTVSTNTQLPAPWADLDIGGPGQVGSASYGNSAFTVNGSGVDIYGSADQFHFVYQPLTGDGQIIARVATMGNIDPWAKAGVMIRESLAANADTVSTVVTQSNGVQCIVRATSGANASVCGSSGGAAPRWVKLTRSGPTFSSAASADGSTWTSLGSATVAMASTVYIGLAVTAHTNSLLNTSTFDNLTVAIPPYSHLQAAPNLINMNAVPGATPAPQTLTFTNTGQAIMNWSQQASLPSWLSVSPASGTLAAGAAQTVTLTFGTTSTTPQIYSTTLTFSDTTSTSTSSNIDNAPLIVPVRVITNGQLPDGWADLDIGNPGQVGSAGYSNGTFTVSGSGADIFGSSDQFHFVYEPLTGDGQIVARVVSVQNTDTYAKVGVMMRGSLDANAATAFTMVTAGADLYANMRSSAGASMTNYGGPAGAAPYWVKVTRAGSVFTSAVSPDGITWTQITAQTLTMGTTIYVGMAVSAHNNAALNSSTFDNVLVAAAPYSHFQPTPSSVFLSTAPGVSPGAQTLTLTNTGQGSMNWSLTSTLPGWLTMTPTSGAIAAGGASQSVTLTFNTPGASPQAYTTTLILNAPNADNAPLLIPVTVSSLPVIANAGFETPSVGSGYQYNPTGAGWTFSGVPGNGSGVTGNGSGFTGGNPVAPDGTQVAFLQGTGTISQDVTNFVANTTYQISFAAARRGNGGGNEDFQIFLDSTSLGTFKSAGTSYTTMATAAFSLTTAGTHTLKFVGLDTAGGDNTAFIDAIRITAGSTMYIASSGFSGVQGQNQWGYQYSTNGESTFPAMTYDSANTLWGANVSGDYYCQVWANGQHPGTTCDSVRTWTAPTGGTVTVSANGVLSVAASCGGNTSGVQVRVLKNGTQIWPATGWQVIPNGGLYSFPSGITATVASGDVLRFVVQHVGNVNYCDSTTWDPIVTLPTP